jgi:hypothetical protein
MLRLRHAHDEASTRGHLHIHSSRARSAPVFFATNEATRASHVITAWQQQQGSETTHNATRQLHPAKHSATCKPRRTLAPLKVCASAVKVSRASSALHLNSSSSDTLGSPATNTQSVSITSLPPPPQLAAAAQSRARNASPSPRVRSTSCLQFKRVRMRVCPHESDA